MAIAKIWHLSWPVCKSVGLGKKQRVSGRSYRHIISFSIRNMFYGINLDVQSILCCVVELCFKYDRFYLHHYKGKYHVSMWWMGHSFLYLTLIDKILLLKLTIYQRLE